MKNIKRYCLLFITSLLCFQAFALEVLPPDKVNFEPQAVSMSSLDIGESHILNVDSEPMKAHVSHKSDNFLTAKIITVNRWQNDELDLLVPKVDKTAVIQNQNFDRMYSS